jgi:hypothetical protein
MCVHYVCVHVCVYTCVCAGVCIFMYKCVFVGGWGREVSVCAGV